jgi:hypothetical protein
MGKLVFPNGAIYKGEWKENKRQGKGQFYFTDFATYNGNWENDMRNGQGEFIFPDGASYTGEFVKNEFQGVGILKNSKGVHIADGIWTKNILKTGFLIAKNEFYAYGEFYRFTKDYFHNDCQYYEGKIKDFSPLGEGKISLPNGINYEGEFKEGFLNFDGIAYFEGDIKQGTFVEGELSGKGKINWNSGIIEHGEYINGKLHGNGEVIHPDGRILKGEFKDGELNGQGSLTRLYPIIDPGIFGWNKVSQN